MSQFEHEAETLFPPLMALEVQSTRVDGSSLVVEAKMSLNMTALTIEQVISKRKKLLTDMVDNFETEVVIKVAAMVGDEVVILGSFELGGITPKLTGVPQVHLTYDLDTARNLKVLAVNHETSSSKEITIRKV